MTANALAISSEQDLCPEDRVLGVLPFDHINAAPLAHGGSLVMPPRFSAARFWAQAIETRCTWLNAVPTMISHLLEGPAPTRELCMHICFCRSASAALPLQHLRPFEQKLGIGIIDDHGIDRDRRAIIFELA